MSKLTLNIIFLIGTISTMAQKPMVMLSVDPKEAQVGEVLTITVKSNVQGEVDIELPSGFVHGYNVMNGMEQEMDYNTGKVVTYYYMSQTGALNKEGSYTFGPAYIKKGNKVFRSNTVTVNIRKEANYSTSGDEISSKQLRQPAFGIIECSKKSIWEGEPIVINAKIYSHFEPSHIEDYQSYSIPGVIDKHEVGNNQRILVDETKIKGVRLYWFTYDKNVVFPTGTGKISIDPYKLLLRRGFESVPITSAGISIDVKPLPKPPSDFAGGVGQFSIERKLNGLTFKQGEVFKMTIEIKGTGNLHNLLEPKLQLPKGFIFYGDPVVTEDFGFGAKGADGKITYEYNIQVTKYGAVELPGTSFSYFDPQKEKYVRISSEGNTLSVEKDKNFKQDNSSDDNQSIAAEKVKIGPMRSNSENGTPLDLYGNPTFWVGVGAPFFLAFLLGIAIKRKEENQDVAEVRAQRKKAIDETDHILQEAKKAFDSKDFTLYFSLLEKAIFRSLALYLRNDESILISKKEALNELEQRGVESVITDRLRLILERCENVRYGMGAGISDHTECTVAVKEILESINRS